MTLLFGNYQTKMGCLSLKNLACTFSVACLVLTLSYISLGMWSGGGQWSRPDSFLYPIRSNVEHSTEPQCKQCDESTQKPAGNDSAASSHQAGLSGAPAGHPAAPEAQSSSTRSAPAPHSDPPATAAAQTQMKPTPPKPTDPFIGDRYAKQDLEPQTKCADSIRSRFLKSGFKEKFLVSVPVLQWKKHATNQEYQRLRHYYGAFGWGALSFDTLVQSLSVLNTMDNLRMFDDWESRPARSPCIRCAVVGNGGILNNSKKGREIDQHDYIFRTNGAVIKGFEEDVGNRTSFYTFSTNTMQNSLRSYASEGFKGLPLAEETRYIFLPDHDRDYILLRAAVTHTPIEKGPERSKNPPTYFGEHVTAKKFKMYHPDFIRYITNRFLRSNILKTKYKNLYRPSTGAVMLLAAVHTCDQVSAYGFMTPDYKKYSNHYYDSSYHEVAFYVNHDMRMEMSLWQQLHTAGIITLYMRN
ncbi:alpha-N-acetylgalactosaminide alpha-2,6-sialyltransferase 2 [Amia ocellicauda]|uniref:alpha-N-acetylgalactosaminide alpha-2,6-sialyltransferase 2 n=1 Tax=Amia ocellicauda TaxID=2972642 RepID=UPI0034639EC4